MNNVILDWLHDKYNIQQVIYDIRVGLMDWMLDNSPNFNLLILSFTAEIKAMTCIPGLSQR